MLIRYLQHRISLNRFVATALAGVCFLTAINAHAAEYQYLIAATARVEHIDNAQRINSEGEDEFLSQQQLRGTLSRATSKLVTNIDYQGTKSNYRENRLRDRTYVTGASSIDWIISPERLFWNLSNSRSLQVLNSELPDTIDNRQVISFTSTGPSVTFQLSGRNKVSGSVVYSIADYERSNLSSQDRTTANILFSHNFSTNYISSIGGNYLQSEIDDSPILDFERYEYFWQNQYVTEVVDLNLSLGQNVLVRDNVDDLENFMARFTASYKVNSRSTFGLNYSDSYEDIFSNMRIAPAADPNQLIGDRLGNSNLNQNYELVQKGITYTYTRNEFFSMNLGYSEAERSYDILIVDPTLPPIGIGRNQFDKVFRAGANWSLFRNLDLSIYGRYTEQDFSDINREQERIESGLRAGYRISQSLYTQFTASHVDQNGTLALDNYDGLNYSLSLTYSLGNQ